MKKNRNNTKKEHILKNFFSKGNASIRNPLITTADESSISFDGSAAGALLLIHTILYLISGFLADNRPEIADLLYARSFNSFIAGGIITQGILIFIPAIVIIYIYKIPAGAVAGERPRAGSVILGIAAGLPAAVVFQGLNNLLIYFLVKSNWQLPVSTTPYAFDTNMIWTASWQIKLIVLLVSALIPAIVEEMMFRGVIQAGLSTRGRGTSVIIWQAIAFMLFHNDPLFMLPPFLSGLLLGYLRYKSMSLFPAIFCHISLNISLLAINPLLPRLTQSMLEISSQTTESLLYASLIASCIAAVALVPMLILISGLSRPEKEVEQTRLVIFPGDWKYALSIIIMLILILMTYYSQLS